MAKQTRKKEIQPYADWCAQIDRDVESMARSMRGETKPVQPQLTSVQRRLVDMMIEHLQALPALSPEMTPVLDPNYRAIWNFVGDVYRARRGPLNTLSNSERKEVLELTHNCGPIPLFPPQ